MNRSHLLRVLGDIIVERKLEGSPLKVAIDGRSASGKTTLADELGGLIRSSGFQVLRPSLDGFHHRREHRYRQGKYSARGYYQDAFDYESAIEYALKPLTQNTFPALCHHVSLDLRTDLPSDAAPVSVGAQTILLFDGVFLMRAELNGYWDLRILVEVDSKTSISRALARDAGATDPAELARKYEVRYEPAWRIYLHTDFPHTKADIIVENTDVARPEIVKCL